MEEHLEQYYCLGVSDNTSAGSSSNPVITYFSVVNSPCGSRPTTPGLKVIDLRILEPLVFDEANRRKSCEQAAV